VYVTSHINWSKLKARAEASCKYELVDAVGVRTKYPRGERKQGFLGFALPVSLPGEWLLLVHTMSYNMAIENCACTIGNLHMPR